MMCAETTKLDCLPDDVLLRILSFLKNGFLLRSIFRINKRFRALSKSRLLWVQTDISDMPINSTSVKILLENRLVGPFTLQLRVGSEKWFDGRVNLDGLCPLLKECTNLENFQWLSGHCEDIAKLRAILPCSLRQLTLKTVRMTRDVHEDSVGSSGEFPNLESLTVSTCPYFTRTHLSDITHPHPCRRLTYLDLSGCNDMSDHLDLDLRVEQAIFPLHDICPNLKYLGLNRVFASNHKGYTGPHEPITLAFRRLSYLEVIDLSGNTAFWHELDPERFTTDFIRNLFRSPQPIQQVKPQVTIALLRWPYRWIASFVDASSSVLNKYSTLRLVVDVDLSDFPQVKHLAIIRWSREQNCLANLVKLVSPNASAWINKG